jgi:hypothetical protein
MRKNTKNNGFREYILNFSIQKSLIFSKTETPEITSGGNQIFDVTGMVNFKTKKPSEILKVLLS